MGEAYNWVVSICLNRRQTNVDFKDVVTICFKINERDNGERDIM